MPKLFLQLLLIVALGVAASLYWQPYTGPVVDQTVLDQQTSLPKTYLSMARRWSYDEQGALINILEADSMRHFPHRDQSILVNPRFYAHNGDDKTWSAHAVSGEFKHSTEKLTLRDKVVLTHDQGGSRLETELMGISFPRKTARSTRPVVLTHSGSRTTANSMLAHFENEKILLANNVKSIYEPPH